ncbi:MAG: hypothetical protein HYS04_15665, partial [Acidobacteria bacterium]|nr:hypothetical protein [Acidobacteriota bacterium]
GVSSTLVPTQVVAFISASPPQLMGINNPQQTVGFVAPGMNFSLRNAANSGGLRSAGAAFLQCVSFNPDAAGDVAKALQASPADAAVARFEEGFATAFKVRTVGPSGANANLTLTQDAQADLGEGAPAAQDIPGAQYNSESGFYAPLLTYPAGAGVRQPGLADQGTRLMLRFANVQAGVSLFVPLTQVAGTGNLLVRLVTTDASGAGPYSPTASTTTGTLISTSGVPVAPVTISGGTGVAVYEVVRSNTSIVERVDIPIVIAFKANTSANLPALGTSTVTGSFAPVSQVGTASETAAIPRFADTPTTRNLAIIAACSTNLLFPFVTNQAGFDTGMAISNTSQDPFGTSPQAGACKINYYGTTTGGGAAPAAQTSTTIAAGSQLTFVLSTGGTNGITGTPGFQGYIIAQCAFQYAHGFAFITDGPIGQARVAEGYLALVMDDGIGSRTGFASEVLAH